MNEDQKARHREAARQWYHKNKGSPKLKARAAEAALRWYHKHKNDDPQKRAYAREFSRRWYHANRDRVLAYRKATAPLRREKQREWHARNPIRKLFTMAKARARRRGIAFSITMQDLEPVPSRCPALGLTLRKGKSSDDPCCFSIDRIDNRFGYVPGNVAIVSRRANVLKRDASLDEMRGIVQWLQARTRSKAMSKGLPRSTSRGAPMRQEIVRVSVPVKNLSITVDGVTGIGFGTAVLGALPQGNILFLGAIAYLEFDAPASGIVATWNGDYAIGSAPTADLTLSGAEVDIIPSTPVGPAVATVSPVTRGANATQVMLDNTDSSLELNLNLIVDDADISANGVILAVNGVVHLAYIVMGDD